MDLIAAMLLLGAASYGLTACTTRVSTWVDGSSIDQISGGRSLKRLNCGCFFGLRSSARFWHKRFFNSYIVYTK
jgi:hypothetical protein